MSEIKEVTGIEILDSRGNPTVEAEELVGAGVGGGVRRAVPGLRDGGHAALR